MLQIRFAGFDQFAIGTTSRLQLENAHVDSHLDDVSIIFAFDQANVERTGVEFPVAKKIVKMPSTLH